MSVATISTAAPVKVSRLAVFWQSQVGKKFVSAVTGVLLFLFVVGHLLDLTIGAALVHSGFVHNDAYLNLVNTFRSVGKVFFYGISIIGLGLHLSHGLYSMWQSLGFRHPLWTPSIQKAGLLLGVFLALAYLLIPAGVVVGLIRL